MRSFWVLICAASLVAGVAHAEAKRVKRIAIGDRSYKVIIKGNAATVQLRGLRFNHVPDWAEAKRVAEEASGCKVEDSSIVRPLFGGPPTFLDVLLDCGKPNHGS